MAEQGTHVDTHSWASPCSPDCYYQPEHKFHAPLPRDSVTGPTQCAVGPSAKSEEVQHMVATCAITSAEGLSGQVPSFADPPLWSLNAPCAKHQRSCDEDNLL